MIHIENINLLFSEKAGILKCAVGFICSNMTVDIVKSSYKSILINLLCKTKNATLPYQVNYLPTYLLYELLSYFKLNRFEKNEFQHIEFVQ